MWALLGYTIVGSSRHLFVGPSSTVAIMSASVVGGIVASSGADFWTVTSWLAILTGIVAVVLGLVRMGLVANFMARPVLDGFIIGLANTVGVSQLDKMFCIEKEVANVIQELGSIARQFSDWDPATMVVGFVSLAALFLMHEYTPRIPAALTVALCRSSCRLPLALPRGESASSVIFLPDCRRSASACGPTASRSPR
ncbi:MAG: SulP family inorganic anion transporter [Actinomycetota bacterium]|nr:SulP family inorganic anion transporter [Actinomycetota bacterium]